MTQKKKAATTLRQLNSELAILDAALSELEQHRTALIHRIDSFSSSASHPSGILQFPSAVTTRAYTGEAHIWSTKSKSIHKGVFRSYKSKGKRGEST